MTTPFEDHLRERLLLRRELAATLREPRDGGRLGHAVDEKCDAQRLKLGAEALHGGARGLDRLVERREVALVRLDLRLLRERGCS